MRLLELGLVRWEMEGGAEGDLFDAEALEPYLRDRRHNETLDAIRRNFGKGALQRGLSRRRSSIEAKGEGTQDFGAVLARFFHYSDFSINCIV